LLVSQLVCNFDSSPSKRPLISSVSRYFTTMAEDEQKEFERLNKHVTKQSHPGYDGYSGSADTEESPRSAAKPKPTVVAAAPKKPAATSTGKVIKVVRDETPMSANEKKLHDDSLRIAPVGTAVGTIDDSYVCPQNSSGDDGKKEEERVVRNLAKKGEGLKDPEQVSWQVEKQKREEENRKQQQLAKIEARKRQHEQKLLAQEGEIPAWMQKHKENESKGVHMKKTVEYEYIG